MNILIVSNYYFPEIGAAPSRITNLAEGLAEAGHNVEVLCPLPNYPKGKIFKSYRKKIAIKEKTNGINVYRYWIYPSVSKNPFIRIISMFSFAASLWLFGFKVRKNSQIDILIIQNSPLLVSMSAIILFKKIYRKKIALNISDLWPLSALELGAVKKGRFYSLLEWIERFNYHNSHLIIGQSQEILDHVNQIVVKPVFLYRNLPKSNYEQSNTSRSFKTSEFKIVYAGLLGIAQGVYDLVTHIDFKSLNVEFHIYGHGNEKENIENYLKENKNTNVFYHGTLSKENLNKILPEFHASIVPLKNRIHGAVPSKIFELARAGVPIIFCGGGEGAKIVNEFKLGYSSNPGDFKKLSDNINVLASLKESDYLKIKNNCVQISKSEFDFYHQLDRFEKALKQLKTNGK